VWGLAGSNDRGVPFGLFIVADQAAARL